MDIEVGSALDQYELFVIPFLVIKGARLIMETIVTIIVLRMLTFIFQRKILILTYNNSKYTLYTQIVYILKMLVGISIYLVCQTKTMLLLIILSMKNTNPKMTKQFMDCYMIFLFILIPGLGFFVAVSFVGLLYYIYVDFGHAQCK